MAAALKSIHKYQLKLLALNSTIDVSLKELLSHFIVCVSSTDEEEDDESFNVNRVLSELLTSSMSSLKDMHYVTTYPTVQSVIFKDVSGMEIKEEVKIRKLDVLAVCDILLCLPKLTAAVESDGMFKSINVIQNFRQLVATENNEEFWKRFECEEGAKLSFCSESQSWDGVWKELKQCLMKMLRYLKEKEILKDVEYNKRVEEIHLIYSWSKQEILQNWHRQLNQQWRSLIFLHRTAKKYITKSETDVHIRISDRQLVLPENQQAAGWLASIIGYIKYFFTPQLVEPSTTIHDFDLDGQIANKLSKTMHTLIDDTFGKEAFMKVVLYQSTKGIRLFDEDEDSVIPLAIELDDVLSIYDDPYSDTSQRVWNEIEEGIKDCIKQQMSIHVFCIRTAWHSSTKINVCITKSNSDPWYQEETAMLLNHLQNWQFPHDLSIKTNGEVLENVATLSFKMSTTNAKYFELMEKFAEMVNEKTSTVSLNIKEINENDIVERLGITKQLATLRKPAFELTTKQEYEDLDLLGESHTSMDLQSPRSIGGGGDSSRLSSPRILVTPRLSNEKSEKSRALSTQDEHQHEQSQDLQIHQHHHEDKSPRKAKIKQHSSIQKRNHKARKEEPESEIIKQDDHRSLKLTEDWIKLEIVNEFLIKPALLSILHNENNNRAATRSTTFPKNPKQLYERLKLMRHNHPKSFAIWRKSELNNILLPDDGREESHSSLWSIDMIYFVIRSSNMLPPPTNGWQQSWQTAAVDGELGFWCWQARVLKKEIDQGRLWCMDEVLINRVECILNGLGYNGGDEMLTKMKEHRPIEDLLGIIT